MEVSDSEKEKTAKKAWEDWLKAGLVIILVVFLYRAIQSAGWLGGLSAEGKELSFGISFLIGVAASLSSCLAVVGGIVIAFSEKYQSGKTSFLRGALWPNLKFHVGRILTFFALGGFLGAVGGRINIGGNFVSVYTIIIAVVMGWLGLSILGFAPPLASFGIKTPKFLLRWWGRLEDSEHQAAPYFLGGITFFLPCGFTQSMQIFALASGSFWAGSSVMLAFSLGTMPVLAALGITASWGKAKNLGFVQKAAGILILIFAVFTFESGLALKNVKTSVVSSEISSPSDQAAPKSSENSGGKFQTVEMHVTSRGFEPSTLTVKAGTPVRWVIQGDQVSGCTSRVIVPSFDISQNIRYGENVVSFMPVQKGEIAFSCGMGMVRGKFIVEP